MLTQTEKKRFTSHGVTAIRAEIMYYPRYLLFRQLHGALFEAARRSAQIRCGRVYGIIGIPMVDTRARFLAPLALADRVVVNPQSRSGRRTASMCSTSCFSKTMLWAAECSETRVGW